MPRSLIVLARVALVLLVALSLVGQVLVVPAIAREVANEAPAAEPFVPVYAVAGVAAIMCAQVAAVCVWLLLGRVARRTIFDRRALRLVDGIVASAAVAAALTLAVSAHVLPIVGGAPLVVLALLLVLVGCAAAALLVGVMRGLLVDAAGLREDLEAVI